MKLLIFLSVVMPRLLRWLLKSFVKKAEAETAASIQKKVVNSYSSNHSALQQASKPIISALRQMFWTTVSVMTMPVTFWAMMYPLANRKFGGPYVSVFERKWLIALMPTISALCALSAEREKTKLFAIFMACTSVS